MTDELRKRIADTIARGRVMLFMKGNPAMPQCGFSAAVAVRRKERTDAPTPPPTTSKATPIKMSASRITHLI